MKSKNSNIIVSYSKPEPKGTSLKLEAKQIHMNMVLLIALVLASPRLNISKRLKLLLLAIGTLFFVHVLLTIFVVKFYSVHVLDSHTDELHSGIMQNIYYWGKNFYEGVGWQFFPFLIWAILCYKTFFFKEEAIPKERTDRNAPCPCGSGRKYKRCCGKVQATGS
ncbi:MAG TPA: SEC-C domain-containing protein [Candidatus Brocadiales bacterium]|nr:SEC-C domain-containing protein [Candidatus Brocadiales bacterium]